MSMPVVDRSSGCGERELCLATAEEAFVKRRAKASSRGREVGAELVVDQRAERRDQLARRADRRLNVDAPAPRTRRDARELGIFLDRDGIAGAQLVEAVAGGSTAWLVETPPPGPTCPADQRSSVRLAGPPSGRGSASASRTVAIAGGPRPGRRRRHRRSRRSTPPGGPRGSWSRSNLVSRRFRTLLAVRLRVSCSRSVSRAVAARVSEAVAFARSSAPPA